MTLREAIETKRTRLTCKDGTQMEVNLLKDGRVLLHHIEKDGQRMYSNRYTMTMKDAETYLKKNLGGIVETDKPQYASPIPERNDSAPDKVRAVPKKRHEFEETADEDDWGEAEPKPQEEAPKALRAPVFDKPAPQQPQQQPKPEEKKKAVPDILKSASDEDDPDPIPSDLFDSGKEEEPEPFQEETIPEETEYQSYSNENTYNGEKYSIIYEDMEMVGDIKTGGSVEIRGTLQGNVAAAGSIRISGAVSGNLTADKDIELINDSEEAAAEVVGDIKGDVIVVQKDCVVIGNISANEILIEGMIKGNLDIQGMVNIKSTAKIKGDITSKTVTIEEGAALDGRCVQKYAAGETPDDFFGSYKLRLSGKPLDAKAAEKKKEEAKKAANSMTVQQMLENK